MQTLITGTTLKQGAYRIERILGQGSFGITYQAKAKITTQGSLGKMDFEATVAIKEFFMREVNSRRDNGSTVEGSSGSLYANYRNKFRREADNLSKLSHDGIVKVYDVFDENGTTYYVMEFIEGDDLDRYISGMKQIGEDEAISIVTEIGEALEYMHSKNMLHLDIKPKNIMRKSDGSYCLIDFGLSKQFTEDGEPESSTTIGLGTPGYAPIEQPGYRQDGTFPATLDVYALGATMYKMLTGGRPPEATYMLNDGFPVEKLISGGVSEHTREVLAKAMALMKRNRYQSVKAFIDALKEEAADRTAVAAAAPQAKPDTESDPQPVAASRPVSGEEQDPVTGSDAHTAPDPMQEDQNTALQPESDPEQTLHAEPGSKPDRKKIFIITAVVATVVAGVLAPFLLKKQPDSIAVDTISSTCRVTDMEWTTPLGEALYTGEIMNDTLEGGEVRKIPHGEGVARISKDGSGVATYEGMFDAGKMSGDATYTLPDGDRFTGMFADGQLANGKFFDKAANEYFEGEFHDLQPYEGIWYSSDDEVVGNVRKGEKFGIVNGHEYVDLGLPSGLKWATCNIGASKPSDYGGYFPWGGVVPASEFSEETSLAGGRTISNLKSVGIIDSSENLTMSHDAARTNWEGTWRMPTSDDFQELIDKCKWTWTSQGGKRGFLVTGSNGRSIFLPAAGHRYEDYSEGAGESGLYMCSSVDSGEDSSSSCRLFFDSSNRMVGWVDYNDGCPVRPVLKTDSGK